MVTSPRCADSAVRSPRLRERAQPRVPAGAAREGRGRRLLGLAGVDAGRWPRASTPAGVRESYAERLPRDAGGRLHGGRRVPLRRLRRGAGGRRRGTRRPASSSSSSRPPTAAAGLDRFRQDSVADYLGPGRGAARPPAPRSGVAPHSVRACPRGLADARSAPTPSGSGLVLHVHADEQPREIEECLAEHGAPADRAARRDRAASGPRTTIVHATHADDARARPPRRARRRRLPLPDDRGEPRRRLPARSRGLLERGIPLCIGSDSNVRIDPLEELRELEGIARRQELRRNVDPRRTSCSRSARRARRRSARAHAWPGVEVDLGHRSLAGVEPPDVPAALVHGCARTSSAGS